LGEGLRRADRVDAVSARDAAADQTVREAYIIFPTLIPFADSTKLNLSEVSFIASSGIGALLSVAERYRGQGVQLGFASVSPAVSSVVGLLNLEQFLSIFGDVMRIERQGVEGEWTTTSPTTLARSPSSTLTGSLGPRNHPGNRPIRAWHLRHTPTSIYGVASRYALGQTGGINLIGIYQVEQSAFNRPQLGFEASANMVGGISTDLRFKPDAVTRFFNKLTSSPAVAPSRLDVNAEFAVTRPDPNRSGQAYLEEFEATTEYQSHSGRTCGSSPASHSSLTA
jgi:anti-anti-sigma factor